MPCGAIFHVPSLTAGFGNFFIVLLILGSVFVFLILFQALLLQRQVLKPVSVITCGMQSLRQGNFGVTLPVPEIRNEFSDMTVTFNFMSSEIQNLKMKLYEEKLDKARMELDYLTLQIKPHFYLNCLNVIYSLNLSGRTELVSQMTSYLMIYFRYLFQILFFPCSSERRNGTHPHLSAYSGTSFFFGFYDRLLH